MKKKKKEKLELRAAPDTDSAFICAFERASPIEIVQIKDGWQYVRVQVGDRYCMGWVKRGVDEDA